MPFVLPESPSVISACLMIFAPQLLRLSYQKKLVSGCHTLGFFGITASERVFSDTGVLGELLLLYALSRNSRAAPSEAPSMILIRINVSHRSRGVAQKNRPTNVKSNSCRED